MSFIGRCPHCHARLELAVRPAPLLVCSSCAGRCVVVFPEEEAEGDVQLELLPQQETRVRDSWLEARGLRRPVLAGVLVLCALPVVILVLGLVNLAFPGSSLVNALGIATVGLLGMVLVALPFTAALSTLVVWFLFGRLGRSAPGFDLRRAVTAVTAGVVTLMVAGCFSLAIRSVVHLDAQAPAILRRSYDLLSQALAALVAGWVTMRLAPSAPYRHALAVGGVVVLDVALLFLASSVLAPHDEQAPAWTSLLSLAYLLFVPLLVLGAWIGVRFGSSRRLASPPS